MPDNTAHIRIRASYLFLKTTVFSISIYSMGSQKLFVILATLAAATIIDAAITEWENPVIAANNTDGMGAAGSLPEGTATGTTAITIVAVTDQNSTTITYTITAQTVANAFTIDSASGIVSLAAALDFEVEYTHVLTIVAIDIDDANGTAKATIAVTNVAPAFGASTYAACVLDDSGAGTTVLTVAATDSGGSNVTYALGGSGNTNTDFEVTSAGVIQVSASKTLDAATTATYTIDAEANDGTDTSTVVVTITVSTTCGTAIFTASIATMFVALVVSFQ